jgi:porphobilinogen synthase
MSFPATRLRRLRRTAPLRDLVRETDLTADHLVQPLFITAGEGVREPISSMPGMERLSISEAVAEVTEIAAAGVRAVILFGIPASKDEVGSEAYDDEGVVQMAVRALKEAHPEIVVITDVCLCEYTSHGHCGVIHAGDVHNDHTIENLGKQAVVAAQAGADMIAPSSMMDGQVTAIRSALDANGFINLPIMAYSSKFASAFYGPFRAAAGCDLEGDRKAYQMNPMNGREALRESDVDEAEGADILMVKPAMPYLDVLAKIRQRSLLPLAAYQVSGEYAMIKFAAQAQAIDEHRVVRESLGAIKRAGADLILTYFAMDIARQGF